MRFNFLIVPAAIAAISCPSFEGNAQNPIQADDMPAKWQYTEMYDQTLPTSDTWWKEFGDPMLDSLISIGVSNNYDVLTARRRIEMARQTLRQTKSAYYPTFTANGGWTSSQASGVTTKHHADASTMSYFDLGVDMNWQLDVFGKITERAKQSKAQFKATSAEYSAMMVTVSAKIATAYLQLRTLQTEVDVLNKHIAQQKRVADITNARHEAGLASMLDVSQSLTTFYSTEAAMLSLNTSISTTINTIAVLTGTFPDNIMEMLSKPMPMPAYQKIVAVGVPMNLLRRRPDVAEAEYTLAGYAAALGVAKKDFLPTLSLSGSIGTAAHDISDLFGKQSYTYSIAPTLSWTIFDGMSRNAAAASARQQMEAGIDNYNNTVLTAVQEVDNAMATYSNQVKYIDMMEQVVAQAEKAFELSIDLYKQGLTDFINVTNSQISYLTYSNELVEAKGQALTSLVNLYQALGGGWENKL